MVFVVHNIEWVLLNNIIQHQLPDYRCEGGGRGRLVGDFIQVLNATLHQWYVNTIPMVRKSYRLQVYVCEGEEEGVL